MDKKQLKRDFIDNLLSIAIGFLIYLFIYNVIKCDFNSFIDIIIFALSLFAGSGIELFLSKIIRKNH